MDDYWFTDGSGRKRHVEGDSDLNFKGGNNTYINTNTNRDRFKSYQDITKKTSCPICKEDVYFIRHNGGSVYVDDLGWPWPKHGCFDNSSTTVKWYDNFYQISRVKDEALTGIIQEISSEIGILLLSIDFGNIGKAKVKIEKTLLADSIIGLLVLINFKKKEIVFSTNFGTKKIVSLKFEFYDVEKEKLYPYITNF